MRRLLLSAALLLVASAPAHSQIVSVYGTYSPIHVSNVQTGSSVTANSTTYNYTSAFISGFGGGVTFNVIPIGPVRIGFDLRGSTKPGTVGADTAFAGIKLGVKPPLLPIKPYVQLSGGYLATRTYSNTTIYGQGLAIGSAFGSQYIAYEALGGLDYSVAPFLDLRVIEIGGGQGFSVGGLTQANGTVSIFTINTGLVLHF